MPVRDVKVQDQLVQGERAQDHQASAQRNDQLARMGEVPPLPNHDVGVRRLADGAPAGVRGGSLHELTLARHVDEPVRAAAGLHKVAAALEADVAAALV